MPGSGKAVQAIVAPRCLEEGTHVPIITIIPLCLQDGHNGKFDRFAVVPRAIRLLRATSGPVRHWKDEFGTNQIRMRGAAK
jgi:hypothetical protein